MSINIGKYEVKEVPGRYKEECFSVLEINDNTSKERTLYTGSLEKCAVLAANLNSGEATPDDIVSVAAACISPYYQIINDRLYSLDVLYATDGKVYLGLRSRYDNRGHYDNSGCSLMFISDNYDAFELLVGRDGGACSRKEIRESGCLTEDEYALFIARDMYAQV